jgi:hypothetical protein
VVRASSQIIRSTPPLSATLAASMDGASSSLKRKPKRSQSAWTTLLARLKMSTSSKPKSAASDSMQYAYSARTTDYNRNTVVIRPTSRQSRSRGGFFSRRSLKTAKEIFDEFNANNCSSCDESDTMFR